MATRRTKLLVKRLLLIGAGGVLVVLGLSMTWSAYQVYKRASVVSLERLHAEEERDSLRARTKELTAALGALNTERGVEEVIRTRYPVVKPGEVEFVFVDRRATTSELEAAAPTSLWDRLQSAFGL
jgi:cell division protein FtsB